jgi:peptide chain release factor 2
MRERTRLERAVEGYRRIEREVDDALELIALGEAEGDQAIVAEAEAGLEKLRDEASKREVESLLSGEADANDCYLEIHAGAGGTEAQDWAEMLLRMYVRWAEAHGYKVEWLEESAGEGAGLKSATVKVSGSTPTGWLKTESGVHRPRAHLAVRFERRRHTSFASAWVYPGDRRQDRGRDQRQGSAHRHLPRIGRRRAARQQDRQRDRLTHMPSGYRRRVPERALAAPEPGGTPSRCCGRGSTSWSLQKREAAVDAMNATKTDIGWGHQIRSYVLQPYQMVKDLRTGVETGNTRRGARRRHRPLPGRRPGAAHRRRRRDREGIGVPRLRGGSVRSSPCRR